MLWEVQLILSIFSGEGNDCYTCCLQEWMSFKLKFMLFIVNVASCASAAYFFSRHNQYCEPGSNHSFVFVMLHLSTHATQL